MLSSGGCWWWPGCLLVVEVDGLGSEWVRRNCHRECRGDLDESHVESHVEKEMLAAEDDAKQHDRR